MRLLYLSRISAYWLNDGPNNGAAYWFADVPQDSMEAAREKLAQMAYCRQPNILFEGSDLHKTPDTSTETMNECQALCDVTPTCHAVTFNDEGCRLKNSEWNANEWVSSEGATSWNKDCGECVKVDTNYVGGDLDVQLDLKTVETPVDCWEICYATPSCTAFTWEKGIGCSLKDDTTVPVSIDTDQVILSWNRDCMENQLTDDNADKVMGFAIKEAEEKSERYADAIESVLEEAERAIKQLDGKVHVKEIETRLHRMALTAEELSDILDSNYGEDELQEEERETKYDSQGIRMTRLDQERAKVRAQADAGKIGGGAIPSSNRLNDLLAPEFDETVYKKDEEMFEDEAADQMQVDRCIERGVTYEEGDLPNGYMENAVTFYQCYRACDERDECAYFVFSQDDGCQLKSKDALASRRYSADFNIKSGARSCFNCSQVGIRYLGGDLHSKPAASVQTFTECQRLCEKSPQCAVYSFTDDVGCKLKSTEAVKRRVYSGSSMDASWTKQCGQAVFSCNVDEHVKDGKCVQCPVGLHNERGDNPAFGDTECDQCTSKGVRFIGFNLKEQPTNIQSASECRLACGENPDCHHMSFRNSIKKCYLKGIRGNEKYTTSSNIKDVAWSKECGRHDDSLTLDEFKMLVLKEADKMIAGAKETALVQQSEIIEKKLPGKKLEELIVSDRDEDIIEVVDTLVEEQERRRRLSEDHSPRKLQYNRRVQRPQKTYTRTVRRTYRRPQAQPKYTKRQPRSRRSTRRRKVRGGLLGRIFGGGPVFKNKKTEDTVVGYLNNVESADFVGLAGTGGLLGNSVVGDVSNILNVIQPLVAAGVTSNKEVRNRQLLEAKLAVLKALPLPAPVQMLFSFAHQMVDKTNGHFGNRSINMPEMMKYLGPITVTAVLEVIGNGHLKDLRNVMRIGRKVLKAGTLKVINVTDVLTLAMATTRTASIFLPMFYVPLQFATGVIKLVRDMGLLDNPRNNAILNNVLGFLDNGPRMIGKAIAGIGKAIQNVVGGFTRFIFGGRRRNNKRNYRGSNRGVQNSIRSGSNVLGGIVGGASKVVGGIVDSFGNIFRGKRRTRNNWRGNRSSRWR